MAGTEARLLRYESTSYWSIGYELRYCADGNEVLGSGMQMVSTSQWGTKDRLTEEKCYLSGGHGYRDWLPAAAPLDRL